MAMLAQELRDVHHAAIRIFGEIALHADPAADGGPGGLVFLPPSELFGPQTTPNPPCQLAVQAAVQTLREIHAP